jgi:hypothetical protein
MLNFGGVIVEREILDKFLKYFIHTAPPRRTTASPFDFHLEMADLRQVGQQR